MPGLANKQSSVLHHLARVDEDKVPVYMSDLSLLAFVGTVHNFDNVLARYGVLVSVQGSGVLSVLSLNTVTFHQLFLAVVGEHLEFLLLESHDNTNRLWAALDGTTGKHEFQVILSRRDKGHSECAHII
jgi:hypothetical protein